MVASCSDGSHTQSLVSTCRSSAVCSCGGLSHETCMHVACAGCRCEGARALHMQRGLVHVVYMGGRAACMVGTACDCITVWHVRGMRTRHACMHVHMHVHVHVHVCMACACAHARLVGEYVVVVLAAVNCSPLLPPARVACWLRRSCRPLDRWLVHTKVGRGRGARPRCWAEGCGMHGRCSSAWWCW